MELDLQKLLHTILMLENNLIALASEFLLTWKQFGILNVSSVFSSVKGIYKTLIYFGNLLYDDT